MKKGFTLSESLISLAIIGVISAVLIPILNNVKPDRDRVMYKKAMYTMQNAIATAIDSSLQPSVNTEAYWADPAVAQGQFCTDVSNAVNTVGAVNCNIIGTAATPNFVTVNGSKWWGLGDAAATDKFAIAPATPKLTKDITVDVNGNGGENAANVDQLRMRVRFDGRVTTDPSWTTENDYLSDALKIKK